MWALVKIKKLRGLKKENESLKKRLSLCEGELRILAEENLRLKMIILSRNNITGYSNFN